MNKLPAKILSAAASAAIIMNAAPLSFEAEAADAYLVRDPFYNYSNGYNYYESEHFQFIWGNSGDASKVTADFLEGNAKNLEACWDVYMEELGMAAPSESTNLYLRDGNEYKTNIYLSGTGLSGMTDDWAYMSYDSSGYAYMFCCVDSMQVNPPSWVLPHEFGHVVTAHQLGWNTNKYSYAWWEAMGNWFREQYLYSDYSSDETGHGTDFFETYLKNLSLTFPCGRDYYAAWPFLQYLTENPDNLDGYGQEFVKTMLQQGQVDEYPFDMVERLAGADLKDTLGHFAKHMAGLDFENGEAYRARLSELLSAGSWNWQQIYTMLEPVAGQENTYKVPTERAPQHAGMNIVPLTVTGNSISVTLNGESSLEGADWRACIVQQLSDGSCVYSDLFSDGDTMTVSAQQNLSGAYLSVIATPDLDTVTKAGLPYGPDSEFREELVSFRNKQQYPYTVVIEGADITKRTVTYGTNWWESYHNHSNGGGIVSDSATVDASVYVAPDAMVLGSASVTGNVRIEDHAVVQDTAKVSDNAVISGYAIVAENASISGNARVDDTALVMGNTVISGNARIIESACVYGNYTMNDYSCAKGMAFCMASGSISGQGVVDGDYYDDGNKTVTKGTACGWVSPQSYVDALSYTDKLMYAYDFTDDSSSTAADRYNSTYSLVNADWASSQTGASGVVSFSGDSTFAELDRGVLYTDDIEIQTAVLLKSSTAGQSILHLGNDSSYIRINAVNENGSTEVIFKNGDTVQTLTSNTPAELGKWLKLRVVLSGDTGKLIINDQTVAQGTITIDPSDIASSVAVSDPDSAYRAGADNNLENCFTGRMDFIRFFHSEATAPTETYTETESIGVELLVGDADLSADINVFDIICIRKMLVDPSGFADTALFTADTDASGAVDIADLVQIQSFILGKTDSFPAGYTRTYTY